MHIELLDTVMSLRDNWTCTRLAVLIDFAEERAVMSPLSSINLLRLR
jgi:hypothetical protein